MNLFLENLVYFIVAFTLVLLFYILVLNRRKKSKGKNEKSGIEYMYLLKKFELKNLDEKTYIKITSIINSFIIAFTSVVVFNIESLVWKILIGFAILVVLIYSLYEITGKILKGRENKK